MHALPLPICSARLLCICSAPCRLPFASLACVCVRTLVGQSSAKTRGQLAVRAESADAPSRRKRKRQGGTKHVRFEEHVVIHPPPPAHFNRDDHDGSDDDDGADHDQWLRMQPASPQEAKRRRVFGISEGSVRPPLPHPLPPPSPSPPSPSPSPPWGLGATSARDVASTMALALTLTQTLTQTQTQTQTQPQSRWARWV
jgi:hypothetical protein